MTTSGSNIAFVLIAILVAASTVTSAQETVFALLKNEQRLADAYYGDHNYHSALELYLKSNRKRPSKEISLKIARCHYFLKEYQTASEYFARVRDVGAGLSPEDLYKFAESLSSTSRYSEAVDVYRQYLQVLPDDELVQRKVWRLDNVQYVLEDSARFSLRSLPFNTNAGELCAAPMKGGVVFLSNRKGIPVVEKTDAVLGSPFYKLWFAETREDSLRPGLPVYLKPSAFSPRIDLDFHSGPVSFYDNGSRMVYTTTGSPGPSGYRPLHLGFAELRDNRWVPTGMFPYNAAGHSNTDPFMEEDGMTLWFSSNQKGGLGGRDLYRSKLVNGKWSVPENLGDIINTKFDEVTPFVSKQHTLYFASNGHPGIGGLDIYKSELEDGGAFQEPQLMGYPLNTAADEFGVLLDSTGTNGFLSSNRKNTGFDDDIYELEMDLQTYPLVISGQLRYKEHNWNDSSELQPFRKARIELIDNIRNVTVFEGSSDERGDFSITIPRFSNYRIRVVGEDHEDHVVSLEIPRQRKLYTNHEIVIVKDAFRSKTENTK